MNTQQTRRHQISNPRRTRIAAQARWFLAAVIAAGLCLAPMPARAVPILPNAVPTVVLNGAEPQSTIAYHPGTDKYYASDTGYLLSRGYVWDAAGTLLQTYTPLNIDVRAWNYNANTGNVELIANNPGGLWTVGLGGGGLLNGSNVSTLPAMATSLQPAYDVNHDRFYSRNNGSNVFVRSRVDGTFLAPITLDLAAAGSPTLTSFFIGYDEAFDVLITVDHPNSRAMVFALDGSYLGASVLPVIATPAMYYTGYTNGQLFVTNQDPFGVYGVDGFQIFVPEPATLFVMAAAGLPLLLKRKRKSRA
ncbi:hypothetical protein LCGC14_0161890 [marine sediment metagenome]|uniref:PEP-CTERM protein-sorting domain-containing protein n=1 Tax=marine sediment metagenome TaxID=412755 RepID=A0A0F9UYX3_9ZZZZ|nr:PEP-CTERM sorting domain-containing protein [Phycisphaerae bacterium]HDZ45048.1 PEP-CTERM sorting domain-containing protein [Phycisphaerae bacterium]